MRKRKSFCPAISEDSNMIASPCVNPTRLSPQPQRQPTVFVPALFKPPLHFRSCCAQTWLLVKSLWVSFLFYISLYWFEMNRKKLLKYYYILRYYISRCFFYYILRQKLLHFALTKILHCVKSYYILRYYYVLYEKLLHFALLLHFVSVITFCGVTPTLGSEVPVILGDIRRLKTPVKHGSRTCLLIDDDK